MFFASRRFERDLDRVKILVTGSAGHLGEALMRTLRADQRRQVIGLDIKASPYTDVVGSIADRACVAECMAGVDLVYHAATLHKPHVATHAIQAFIDTNVSGTLALLEAAVDHAVTDFIFTSTTSVFGHALRPAPGEPAAWVTEETVPVVRNIYGVTKKAAEDLCELFHRQQGLNCIILRTSRFFPEADDDRRRRERYSDANLKTNEFLYRRVELEDVVTAHLKAAEKASVLGFGRYIISATTPFRPEDRKDLNRNAPKAVRRRVPQYEDAYASLGWKMLDCIDRVYVNDAARSDLGWEPKFDFPTVLERQLAGEGPLSDLAAAVGSKGYHDEVFNDGPYPVDS